MAAGLGPLGIGLCVVFGAFIVVLLVEVYYILYCRHRREIHDENLSSTERGLIPNLKHTTSDLLDLACWRRRLKSGINYLFSGQRHHHHSNSNNGVLSTTGIEQSIAATEHMEDNSSASPSLHSEFVAKLFPLQGDLSEDVSDILHLQALLGPPRLLFTIKEETKEDLDSEDAKSKGGRSRAASRASSEIFPHLNSGCVTPIETPFATPPSSPPLTTPTTSPPLPVTSPPLPAVERTGGGGGVPPPPLPPVQQEEEEERGKTLPYLIKPMSILIDESSSSFSSSSSENVTPPISSSPPRNLLTTLVEETSSSSSSSAATPFDMSSPSRPPTSPNRGGSSLEAILDNPPQNRIDSLETPSSKPADSPIRDHQFPRFNLLFGSQLEGVPVLGVSPPHGFPSTKIEELDSPEIAFPSRQFPNSDDFSSTPSRSWPPSPLTWPPSPQTPPLLSAVSSPLFTSPTLGSVDASSPFCGA